MNEIGGADISPCGTYRMTLCRRWDDGPALLWVMLNPSTADASKDDPTIRKVRGFTKRLGFGAFEVVNLYALRATDPRALRRHPDPVGPGNDTHLRIAIEDAHRVIVAWGAHAPASRVREVFAALHRPREVLALATTKAGHPSHPLMLPYYVQPKPWNPSELLDARVDVEAPKPREEA